MPAGGIRHFRGCRHPGNVRGSGRFRGEDADLGTLDEFPLSTRLFLRAYRWRRIDPVPWTPLARPLAEATVALVSSAGLVLPEQEPFDGALRGGDPSVRFLPGDADVSTLMDTHRSQSYDHAGVRADPNLAFPLDRLRELAARGRVGAVASTHLSFMGSITAPGRFLKDTLPDAAERLVADGAQVALLVPV
jgi:D-proline reductase (dithiol) PrdB